MNRTLATAAILAFLATLAATPAVTPTQSELEATVADVERAFAQSMADRDHAAFATFLAEETVFHQGADATRGKAAVAAQWSRFFEGETAPFSWEPATVSVLESGTLALSTGPVWNPEGVRISTYTSIWRLEAPGVWRIIFDKGDRYCE